jgi:uncharacterized protein YkwD
MVVQRARQLLAGDALSSDRHQPFIRKRVVMVVLAAVVVLASSASATDMAQDPSLEREFVEAINEFRSDEGLPALQLDANLTTTARTWAADMASAGRISHATDLSVGVVAAWEKLGENVGVGPNVAKLHRAFLDSPAHRDNLADPDYTHIGIGVVRDGNTIYTTHRFMEPAG